MEKVEKNNIALLEIESKISQILKSSHKHPLKHDIIHTSSGLEFACPICGDSHKQVSKKRGKLWYSNMYYVCYNEGCNMSLSKLLSTFDISLTLETSINISKIEAEHKRIVSDKQIEDLLVYMDKLVEIDDVLGHFNESNPKLTIRPLSNKSIIYTYIVGRGVKNPKNIYAGRMNNQPVIIFMNMIGNKVISMQIRSIDKSKRRMFHYYPFSRLYHEVNNKILTPDESVVYDSLSPYFNLFTCDLTRPIYVFEGQVNAQFIPNSISLVGVNTDIDFLINQGLNLKLCYDYDQPGLTRMLRYAKSKQSVFMWKKFIIDNGLKNKNINDVADVVSVNEDAIKEIPNYFTRDSFDVIFV